MFERKSKLKQQLGAANATIEKFNRLKKAITEEVTGPLATSITQYQNAQAALSAAEVKRALGEVGEDGAAEKRLAITRAELDRESAKTRGLRGGLAALGTELAGRYESLNAELPEHFETVRKEFAAEWSEAVRAFGVVLGKRAALEAALGEPLRMLPQPTAIAGANFGAVQEPKNNLRAIKLALSELRMWRDFESSIDLHGKPIMPLSACEVFQLRTAEDGLPFGAFVAEASFPFNRLAQLAQSGLAVPATNAAASQSLLDADSALQAIEAATHQQRADDIVRKDRERPDFEDHGYFEHYPTLSAEERKRRADPNNPAYAPKGLPRDEIVRTFPGQQEKKFEAPEPLVAPSVQE